MKKIIRNERFGEERALYRTANALVENCRFEGEEDGESFLKESRNIEVKNCYMDLRYPMWHVSGLKIENCVMTERCRAALWYDKNVKISGGKMDGIKALRACKSVELENVAVRSPEFGWKCEDVSVKGGSVVSEYAFFESRSVSVEDLDFSGKYSFQYNRDLTVSRSRLETKDAFWHAKNVVVIDCELNSEYLGWYSDGLTLVRCRIRGTQPLCYCKNLKLVDCVMEDCDLAFEYSDVEADLVGTVRSVKNPRRGRIVADGFGELILSGGKYRTCARIEVRGGKAET